MLHFVKNEDEVRMIIDYEDLKVEAVLYTTNEVGKKFYELLKEKKTMKLTFNLEFPFTFLLASYDDEKNFRLVSEKTIVPSIEKLEPLHIVANQQGLGILLDSIGMGIYEGEEDFNLEGIVIGYILLAPKTSYQLFEAIYSTPQNSIDFALSLSSTNNYNIDLLFLISFIIIIILLFVCILSK